MVAFSESDSDGFEGFDVACVDIDAIASTATVIFRQFGWTVCGQDGTHVVPDHQTMATALRELINEAIANPGVVASNASLKAHFSEDEQIITLGLRLGGFSI